MQNKIICPSCKNYVFDLRFNGINSVCSECSFGGRDYSSNIPLDRLYIVCTKDDILKVFKDKDKAEDYIRYYSNINHIKCSLKEFDIE